MNSHQFVFLICIHFLQLLKSHQNYKHEREKILNYRFTLIGWWCIGMIMKWNWVHELGYVSLWKRKWTSWLDGKEGMQERREITEVVIFIWSSALLHAIVIFLLIWSTFILKFWFLLNFNFNITIRFWSLSFTSGNLYWYWKLVRAKCIHTPLSSPRSNPNSKRNNKHKCHKMHDIYSGCVTVCCQT